MPSLVPEIYCTDVRDSLDFYTSMLPFSVLYERADEGFAMLVLGGSQLMLDEIGKTRDWLCAPLERPFGRGVNFQIEYDDVATLHAKLLAAKASIFLPLEEKSYLVDGEDVKVLQFIVQDPDGYMLRFQQEL